MSDEISEDQLVAYLAMRHSERMDAVERLAASFTERERRLIREAAVMGYVQGAMQGRYRDKIPSDIKILREVLDGILAHPDLYPVTAQGGRP